MSLPVGTYRGFQRYGCVSKNIIRIVETAWTVERTYSIRQLQFEDAPRTTFFEDVVHVILDILLTGGPCRRPERISPSHTKYIPTEFQHIEFSETINTQKKSNPVNHVSKHLYDTFLKITAGYESSYE